VEAHAEDTREPEQATTSDDEIRALVARLSRPHRTGGRVIERATMLAEGSDFDAVLAWIEAHGGEPEAPVSRKVGGGGLHSGRLSGGEKAPAPLRFILPAAALA
jgi:hypothetical protein